MRLLNDRVGIEKLDDDAQTKSGIILANLSRFIKGRVVGVGNGLLTQNGERVPLTVEPGDTVLYDSAATILDQDGVSIVRESDIIAIVED